MLRTIAVLALAWIALLAPPASAATISIVSGQYSAAHPVPHLHYEGATEAGDVALLEDMYKTFGKCRLSCLGPDGGATAVLTLSGPGGDYQEGLKLADFLRANHIATVVERGMQCYSACAFAFLGGSGYSAQEDVGTYIDRMVEPGSVVGFHAPYALEDAYFETLNKRGAMEAQGETRSSLALMVKELVKWNMDPEVLFYMVGMGPDETYNLLTADDLYLARVALPPTPTSSWITDLPEAVRNVCIRLLAIDNRADPLDMQEKFLSGYTPGIGTTEFSGPISGYKLGDRLLDIGNCSITDESAATDGDYEIALYFTPGIMGYNSPGTSFFNRQDGWSSAGTGGNPYKRILQRGPMNHYFLKMGVPIDELDLPGEFEIDKNRFNLPEPPAFATLPEDAVIDSTMPTARVSHIGNVFILERIGTDLVYESALAADFLGRTVTSEVTGEDSFFREGTANETGGTFAQFGFRSGATSTVVNLVVANQDGVPATPEQLDDLHRIECAMAFGGQALTCE